MFNKMDKVTKIFLIIITVLLFLNLLKSFNYFPSARAEEGQEIGRYKMSVWSVQGSQGSFNPNGYYGYYIIDTKTGKVIDERLNNL